MREITLQRESEHAPVFAGSERFILEVEIVVHALVVLMGVVLQMGLNKRVN